MGQGAAQPSLQAGCINEVGADKSGVATSTYYLGGDICQGIGPMLGGFVVQIFVGTAGYTAIFDVCGVLLLAAFVFFVFITGKKKSEKIDGGRKNAVSV